MRASADCSTITYMPRVLLTGFAAVPGPRRAGVQLRHVIRSLTPLHTVDLLVVQGANGPRVNKRESDQIVMAVRDRGIPVEYLVAPDEGHGFARPINNLAMIMAMETFLAKKLASSSVTAFVPSPSFIVTAPATFATMNGGLVLSPVFSETV